jgi:hypothetical protein
LPHLDKWRAEIKLCVFCKRKPIYSCFIIAFKCYMYILAWNVRATINHFLIVSSRSSSVRFLKYMSLIICFENTRGRLYQKQLIQDHCETYSDHVFRATLIRNFWNRVSGLPAAPGGSIYTKAKMIRNWSWDFEWNTFSKCTWFLFMLERQVICLQSLQECAMIYLTIGHAHQHCSNYYSWLIHRHNIFNFGCSP